MNETAEYALIQTETRQMTGPNFAYNELPDVLWECPDCGAAVRDRDRHSRWHAAQESSA